MRFFFLAKILRIFYGNLKKHRFKNICNSCVAKKTQAVFLFLKTLEFRLPMFIYRMGFSPSLLTAKFWVTSGLIKVNGKLFKNNWHTLHLYDFVEFDPSVWKIVSINLVKILFYGS